MYKKFILSSILLSILLNGCGESSSNLTSLKHNKNIQERCYNAQKSIMRITGQHKDDEVISSECKCALDVTNVHMKDRKIDSESIEAVSRVFIAAMYFKYQPQSSEAVIVSEKEGLIERLGVREANRVMTAYSDDDLLQKQVMCFEQIK